MKITLLQNLLTLRSQLKTKLQLTKNACFNFRVWEKSSYCCSWNYLRGLLCNIAVFHLIYRNNPIILVELKFTLW